MVQIFNIYRNEKFDSQARKKVYDSESVLKMFLNVNPTVTSYQLALKKGSVSASNRISECVFNTAASERGCDLKPEGGAFSLCQNLYKRKYFASVCLCID